MDNNHIANVSKMVGDQFAEPSNMITMMGVEGLRVPNNAEWLRISDSGVLEFCADQKWHPFETLGEYWQTLAASYAETKWAIRRDACVDACGEAFRDCDCSGNCKKHACTFHMAKNEARDQAQLWRSVARKAGEL